MSEFKGTPAPWFFTGKHDECEVRYVCSKNEYSGSNDICTLFTGGAIEQESNANLIAAAPELLEALQEMVAIVKKHTYPQPDKPSSTWGRMEAAEAVIARALGQ